MKNAFTLAIHPAQSWPGHPKFEWPSQHCESCLRQDWSRLKCVHICCLSWPSLVYVVRVTFFCSDVNAPLVYYLFYLRMSWDLSVCIQCICSCIPCVFRKGCATFIRFFAYVALPPSFVCFFQGIVCYFWWKINLNLTVRFGSILKIKSSLPLFTMQYEYRPILISNRTASFCLHVIPPVIVNRPT